MHLAAEHASRDRAADQGGGDVVEKARQDEYEYQKYDAALPVIRKQRRHFVGHAALLEVARQQRKAH